MRSSSEMFVQDIFRHSRKESRELFNGDFMQMCPTLSPFERCSVCTRLLCSRWQIFFWPVWAGVVGVSI